jgi:hypothetical protein
LKSSWKNFSEECGIEWLVDTQGIVADLDDEDEDVDIEGIETNDILTDDDGVMQIILAIQKCIRKRLRTNLHSVNSGSCRNPRQ